MKRADDRADDRTLTLATHPLTAEELDRFLVYQGALWTALKGVNPVAPEVLAEAHTRALEKSRLDPELFQLIRVVVRRFAGNRATAQHLTLRYPTVSESDPESGGRIAEELARLEGELLRRGGEATVQVLKAREGEILALHRQVGHWG
jgi:hypothetical protein